MSAVSVLDPHASRTVFDSACALAWADGELVEPELRAIRGLAIALGLSEILDGTNEALAHRSALPSVWRVGRLEPRARVLCVSAAAWIAVADGTLHPREADALATLALRCRLEPATARFAHAHATWATQAFAGAPPHRAASHLLVEGARRAVLVEAHRAAA